MQNIGFSNSGYVKPPQPSCSAVHRAPPFTGYRKSDPNMKMNVQAKAADELKF